MLVRISEKVKRASKSLSKYLWQSAGYIYPEQYVVYTLSYIIECVTGSTNDDALIDDMDLILGHIFNFFTEFIKSYSTATTEYRQEFWRHFFTTIGCTGEDISEFIKMGCHNIDALSRVMGICWGYNIKSHVSGMWGVPAYKYPSGSLRSDNPKYYHEMQDLGKRLLDKLLKFERFNEFCSKVQPVIQGKIEYNRLFFMVARLLNGDVGHFMHLLLLSGKTKNQLNTSDMQRNMVNNVLSVFFSDTTSGIVAKIISNGNDHIPIKKSQSFDLPDLTLFSAYPKNISSMVNLSLPKIPAAIRSFDEYDRVVQTIRAIMESIKIETVTCEIAACSNSGEFARVSAARVPTKPDEFVGFGIGCLNVTCASEHPICSKCSKDNQNVSTSKTCPFCRGNTINFNLAEFINQLVTIQEIFSFLAKIPKCQLPFKYYPKYMQDICTKVSSYSQVDISNINDEYLNDLAQLIDICKTVLDGVINTTDPEAKTIEKIDNWKDLIMTKRPRSSTQSRENSPKGVRSSTQSRGNSPKSSKRRRGGARKKTLRIKRANRRKSKKQRKSRIN
jgi:hypothetical protein